MKNLRLYALAYAVLVLVMYCSKLAASSEQIIFTFPPGGSWGSVPSGGLISDAAGNLYGTTASGGAHQCGAVFKLSIEGVLGRKICCTASSVDPMMAGIPNLLCF